MTFGPVDHRGGCPTINAMVTAHEPYTFELSDGREIVIQEASHRHPDEYALGAYHRGELAGLLVCEPDPWHHGDVVIFIQPDWRGVGIGRALLRCMTERAVELGLDYLTLAYRMDNTAAADMVASSGLVVARRIRDGVVKAAVHTAMAA